MFKYGEIVEVARTKDFKELRKRIYLTHIQNANLPHLCVDITQEEQFRTGHPFDYVPWAFARRLHSYALNSPLIVWNETEETKSEEERRYFARCGENCIYTFPTGKDSWTFRDSDWELVRWAFWRLPTQKELMDVWEEKDEE